MREIVHLKNSGVSTKIVCTWAPGIKQPAVSNAQQHRKSAHCRSNNLLKVSDARDTYADVNTFHNDQLF